MDNHSNQPLLLRQVQDGVATLTLNRPDARNALSMALMGEMLEGFRQLGEDKSVKVVILAAAGPGFCAGHDLKELRSKPKREIYHSVFRRCSELMQTIVALPKPVIAQVHGIATAAGCQLVATCDLAIAGEDARFATPGVN
ncbi:MAG TPA: enoyl-CoA hydratase-related protein, partial [Candidatus Polarisedimenticolia bacterium]|nr:enoyl-CoA hydratase-related protein [Candidatus Polarisedimenticolia bacterium]